MGQMNYILMLRNKLREFYYYVQKHIIPKDIMWKQQNTYSLISILLLSWSLC